MIRELKYLLLITAISACNNGNKPEAESSSAATSTASREQHRPQIHFSPPEKWMNDPNGMVFYNNQYHLFYQYYPDSTVWGPMHWGHATSTDLVNWKHQPIALYPDSLGYIFSGSAVADVNNTSGLGKDGKVPLVAIFTHHNAAGEKAGKTDYQVQSLAYSLDDGATWTKYANNPVLKNPGIKDFRDPKVSWHQESKKWIMTLAVQDRIAFYSSPNLLNWTKESEFGKTIGAHGGVWECPDLFTLDHNGQKVWVLLVSINPGAPNGGSATQYFTGSFDGKTFTPFDTTTRWIDYGPDNYAGVTWSNTGDRKIFMGWMSNWLYAQEVPTEKWRSAMTVPRDLALEKIGNEFFLRSMPVPELDKITIEPLGEKDLAPRQMDVIWMGKLNGPAKLEISADEITDFELMFSNDVSNKLLVGYDKASNSFFIDRSGSGNARFKEGFDTKATAPRISKTKTLNVTFIIDVASIELFADNGLSVMTGIFFPERVFSNITLSSKDGLKVKSLRLSNIKPVF
jgi:fructan beta-fructosidase